MTSKRTTGTDFVFGLCASGNCHLCPGTLPRPDVVRKEQGQVIEVLETGRTRSCTCPHHKEPA